jgi:eukaryotic-like serine/threonine-protein kinase
MTPEQYQLVGELYHAALELAPEARPRFLARACDGADELRREVEALLRANEQADEADGFISAKVADVAALLDAQQKNPSLALSLVGRNLSHYQVLSLLGAGGMGEVYLAQDTRLGRKVALKLLPRAFTRDEERLRRFKQEALAISALNHPNILTVYDIGTAATELGGAPFIVAELLEGQELRKQMQEGPLPVRRGLEYARQIASGLAAAHEKGIVHRDLKPENLFVTKDGLVKILDFGLAKLYKKDEGGRMRDEAGVTPPLHPSSLIPHPLTSPGMVLGTIGYMSPEQVRGQETDHRSDIFSFGLILYEVFAGRRAFQGDSSAETMAAIVKEEPPDLAEANPKIPPQLEQIVLRCLEKQPVRRFQTASDLCFALEALLKPSGTRLETALAARRRLGREKWWMVATGLAALAFAWAYFTRPASEALQMKLSLALPEKMRFVNLALSPDGKWLAFNVQKGSSLQLWTLALATRETKLLDESARNPFWSPDSRFIGYFSGNKLKKVALNGGLPITLCDFPRGDGGAWNREDVILISGWGDLGLSRVSASGGPVTPVLPPEANRPRLDFRYPSFLPDGRHFIGTLINDDKEPSGIYLGSLDGGPLQRLLADISNAVYAADVSGVGYLFFGREGALLAQPFDAKKLRLDGEPFPVAAQVAILGTIIRRFSASENGMLVFDPIPNRLSKRAYWVDRSGKTINSLKPLDDARLIRLAPDGQRVVVSRYNQQAGALDLWLSEVTSGTDVRLTADPADDHLAIWSPDASRLAWSAKRGEHYQIYEKTVSQTGQEAPLLQSNVSKYPTDWSPDGRYLIYFQTESKTKRDVWALPLFGERKPFPLLQTQADEGGGALSPDGQWLAYYSDEAGRYEIYVQRFSDGSDKRRISTSGGVCPQWRGDGKELYYQALNNKLMAAPVTSGASLAVGAPVAIVEFPYNGIAETPSYSVSRDGRRFLLNATVEAETNSPLTVLVNWMAGMKK